MHNPYSRETFDRLRIVTQAAVCLFLDFPTNSLCFVASSALKSSILTNSALKYKTGPEFAASEGTKTLAVTDKAWHSRADMVQGVIISRTWSMVGKDIGHTRTMETMNNCYLWVRFGDRRHHSGTLTNMAPGFGLTRTDDDVQRK